MMTTEVDVAEMAKELGLKLGGIEEELRSIREEHERAKAEEQTPYGQAQKFVVFKARQEVWHRQLHNLREVVGLIFVKSMVAATEDERDKLQAQARTAGGWVLAVEQRMREDVILFDREVEADFSPGASDLYARVIICMQRSDLAGEEAGAAIAALAEKLPSEDDILAWGK